MIIELGNIRHYDEDNLPPLTRHHSTPLISNTKLHVRNDDSFTIKRSSFITGLNRYSGKRYTRWKTDSVYKIGRGKRGQMVPYIYSNGKHYGGWYAFAMIGDQVAFISESLRKIYPELDDHIKKTVELSTGNFQSIEPFRPDRPMAWTQWGYGTFDLLQREPADFIRTLFGTSRYRKDLVKTAFESDLDVVLLASTMKDRVPMDWLIDFMGYTTTGLAGRGYPMRMSNPLGFRPVARKLNDRTLRRLLKSSDSFSRMETSDVIRFGPTIENFGEPRDWHQLHASLTTGRVRREYNFRDLLDAPVGRNVVPRWEPQNLPVAPTKWTQKIHDCFKDSGFVHEYPKDTEELSEWSNYMSNCIRSYADEAASGMISLGAVLDAEGKMIANYEVDSMGRLKQLLGRFNRNLSNDVIGQLEAIFIKAGVNVSTYWGRPNDAPLPRVDMARMF